MNAFFFAPPEALARIVAVGLCAYAALVLLLRVSGKRTLSKMNAFDFVVTVALGSTLATVLLSKDIALVEGVLAFAILILAQYVVAWISVRSSAAQSVFKSEPRLLAHRGALLPRAMRRERVTEDEVQAALRKHGVAWLEDAEAVVLETDGAISVIRRNGKPSPPP